MNKNTRKQKSYYMRKFMIPAILLIQFVAIAVLGYFVYFNHQAMKPLYSHALGELILDAVEGLSKPAHVDPQTGNVYIHEAKLTLPPQTEQNPVLLYSYSPPSAEFSEEVRLIDKNDVTRVKGPVVGAQNLEELFEAVPRLQACARGYLIVFAERTETDIPKVLQKQLKDGRTAYVYLEDECTDGKEIMLSYLQHIESY